MSEDIYTQFGIDKSKLKRDYITNPLKRGEIPFKEDIEYLYIELNIVKTNLPLIFQSNLYVIDKALSHYKIKKPRNLIYFHYINTCMSKYGAKCYSQTKECRKKVKQTLKERYGNENYVNVEKYKENCLKKYGVPTTALLPNVIKKKQETCLKKYGSISYQQSEHHKKKVKEIMEKQYNTKKEHNTFTISNQEIIIFDKLKSIYPNTKKQYKSEKYPFTCDFYIPEIDTYIEYQGHWSHGKEPYIDTDSQRETVKLWESKNTKYYNNAIEVWTKRDVNKRQIAKENHINWIEFFNMQQFMEWFNLII